MDSPVVVSAGGRGLLSGRSVLVMAVLTAASTFLLGSEDRALRAESAMETLVRLKAEEGEEVTGEVAVALALEDWRPGMGRCCACAAGGSRAASNPMSGRPLSALAAAAGAAICCRGAPHCRSPFLSGPAPLSAPRRGRALLSST